MTIDQTENAKPKKSDPRRIAFIGAGNMATAMIFGILKTQNAEHPEMVPGVYNRTPAKCEKFSAIPGMPADSVKIFGSAKDAVEWGDFIVLAVKPQNYEEVLTGLRDSGCAFNQKVFVSIAAGVTVRSVCEKLGQEVPVIRTMPNTPLLIGMGSTALSRSPLVSEEDFAFICKMFGAMGTTLVLPEEKMNAVISATSSAPAYIYLMIEAMDNAAREQGLDAKELLDNICQMVEGSAEMVRRSGDSPEELIRKVTSPNGTTERAMKVFDERKLKEIVRDAMQACTDRAEEMSRLF